MVGALPCDILMHEKPRGHGYMELEATGEGGWFEPGLVIRGHEFHYSEVVGLDPARPASPTRCGAAPASTRSMTASSSGTCWRHTPIFTAWAPPGWAEGFVEFVRGNGSEPQPRLPERFDSIISLLTRAFNRV